MQTTETPQAPTWRPPPQAPACLILPYSSRPNQKGGTLIVEEVQDLKTHRRRLCSPDGYRPNECLRCHGTVLHVHDYRERFPRRDPCVPAITVVRYQCVDCGATWRVLPQFLPRLLWYGWRPIEAVVLPGPEPMPEPVPVPADRAPVALSSRVQVPARTSRRWRARLRMAALVLVQLFATVGAPLLERLATTLGFKATRHDLVFAYTTTFEVPQGHRLAVPAAHSHRLEPGLRLM